MPLADIIQRIVHFLDVGKGPRIFRAILVGLLFFGIYFWYDLHHFRNFSNPEAMDSAQLARNIAEGRGYTTDCIRPFSIYLVGKWNQSGHGGQPTGPGADYARLAKHPDLQNPPVYPLFLAGLMKVLPFHQTMEFSRIFWSEGGRFARYQPDFLIAVANQLLMLVVVAQIFFIARKLFDLEVASLSAALVFGCETFWQFSLAGLSTMLVIIFFLGLTRLLIAYEEESRAPVPSDPKLMGVSIAAGVAAGLGTLTLYSFGWVIVPVTIFLALYGGRSRGRFGVVAVGSFALVLAPWVLRNYWVSGTPLGTAGFAAMSGTFQFNGFRLEQSLHPDLTLGWFVSPYLHKLWPNLTEILQNDLPRLGRNWATMLFFAGLLLSFRGLGVRRLRYFLVLCLGMFVLIQALGRTGLTDLTPEINSENLLVILLPLILMFGTVCFVTFLDQYEVPEMLFPMYFRYSVISAFLAVMCLPFIGSFIANKSNPIAYPPYYPPEIRMSAGWMKENELMMSDVPWAVAWYGQRQCVWLTLNTSDEFFALNDFIKPVHALYLTPETLDKKLFSECVNVTDNSWGKFALRSMGGDYSLLPLSKSPGPGIINSGVFLTDRPRWLQPLQ